MITESSIYSLLALFLGNMREILSRLMLHYGHQLVSNCASLMFTAEQEVNSGFLTENCCLLLETTLMRAVRLTLNFWAIKKNT